MPESQPHQPAGETRRESGRRNIHGAALKRSLKLVTAAWMIGAIWMHVTAGAPTTLFAKKLGASEFQFGVLSAIPFIATLLSLPASLLIERTGRRKLIFFVALYLNRLMWVPIGLVPIWMMRDARFSQQAIVLVFLGLMFVMQIGQAVGSPAWYSWMADVVPDRVRGKYFAKRRSMSILTAVPAAILSGWLLDHYVDPSHTTATIVFIGWIFVCSMPFGMADIATFHFIPTIPKAPQKGLHLVRSFVAPFRNRQFIWFALFVATMTFGVSFMGQFVTLYLTDRVKVSSSSVQLMLLVAPLLAQLLVLAAWGRLIDRMGKKPALELATLGLVPVALLWLFVSPQHVWVGYVASALGAALWCGVEVANFNIVLETASSMDNGVGSSSYVAVNSVVVNIAGCVGGLAAGVIADRLKGWEMRLDWLSDHTGISTITYFEVLFAVSALFRLIAGAFFLPMIKEPRARPTREALRFMTENIYNNLFNAVLMPLRAVESMLSDKPRR